MNNGAAKRGFGKVITVKDINKNGKKDGFEVARAKGMAKGMGARVELKSGGRPGLWANINARKKAGTSRSKKNSTISKKAYANMKKGFPDKKTT